ncbi:hypothetical protein [Rhodovulum strictum]|uniref:Uncharacterized protein n=1 Tax=Rhodovulum strictum TaxID=58314 RepID=A0A844B4I9_9RHOB|nr:hypothetical protein [Rhodovulum strictum]MRH21091.1 hypothetical protein [Rhodovulum strictum]
MILEWGAVTQDERVCVATRGSEEDEEFGLHVGRRVDGRMRFAQRAEVDDLVALSASPPAWQGACDFVALSGEGEVTLVGAETRTEQIAGAGYTAPGAAGYGRMSSLVAREDHLFALGYGGQAYLKETAGGPWRFLSLDFPRAANDTTVFYSAMRTGSGGYLFGGEFAPRPVFSDALLAANAAGDATRVAELLIRGRRTGHGVLWALDGAVWRPLDLPTGEQVFFLDRLGERVLVVCVRAASLLDPAGEEIVAAPIEPDAPVKGLLRMRGGVQALTGGVLVPMDGTEPAPGWAEPLPAPDEVFCAAGSASAAYAFEDARILVNEGNGWQVVPYEFIEG